MRMFAGLDVGFKRTAVCMLDKAGRIVWRGVVDTHPEALSRALQARRAVWSIAAGAIMTEGLAFLGKGCAQADPSEPGTSW
jgi:hypothetical protein